jgi:hypothetical protein
VLLHAAQRRDGWVVPIDSRTWLQHQREVGAAYRSELARELATLGFQIECGTGRGERYFELAGVPQRLLDRWSSRHHQVQAAICDRPSATERELRAVIADGGPGAADAHERLELLLATGQLAPAEERLMGTITRAGKVAVTAAALDAEWQGTARDSGSRRNGSYCCAARSAWRRDHPCARLGTVTSPKARVSAAVDAAQPDDQKLLRRRRKGCPHRRSLASSAARRSDRPGQPTQRRAPRRKRGPGRA